MAIFDSYIVIDWSAAATPKIGADSIWLGIKTPSQPLTLYNPATRHQAMAIIKSHAQQAIATNTRLLIAIDIGLSYPIGFDRLMPPEYSKNSPPWRILWDYFADNITDDEHNHNNRHDVLNNLNKIIAEHTGQGIFWGNNNKHHYTHFPNKKIRRDDIAEYRFCETQCKKQGKSRPQSQFQCSGIGAVGGQSALGLYHLAQLQRDPEITDHIAIYPYENITHLGGARQKNITLSETYLSLFHNNNFHANSTHDIKDARQCEDFLTHITALDQQGGLLPMMLAPLHFDTLHVAPPAQHQILHHEGWILGLDPQHRQSPTHQQHYIHTPQAIYDRSFNIINTHIGNDDKLAHIIKQRMIHAIGDASIADDIIIDGDIIGTFQHLYDKDLKIFCDCQMLTHAIIKSTLPPHHRLICNIDDARTAHIAQQQNITKSMAQVELWRDADPKNSLKDSIVVIGNAPTALFTLLEMIKQSPQHTPKAIIALPVGFVGAAEAKYALTLQSPCPYITLLGARGGSAVAGAALNAINKYISEQQHEQ